MKKARLGNRQWLTVVYTALGEHPILFGKGRAILSWITTIAAAAIAKARGDRNPRNLISIAYLIAGELDFTSDSARILLPT